MNKQLSVVIPVYNVEEYLERCVASIVNQTYPVYEIILVDDGSTDQSGRIADELAERWSIIHVIHQQNGGLSKARNRGIDIATGELIGFVDSDDYIDTDMYAILISHLLEEKAEMSIGGVWYEQENGKKYTPYSSNIYRVWTKEEALVQLNSYKFFNMSFCNVVFRHDLFDCEGYGEGRLRFPLGKKSEDQYLMHKVIARTSKVVYTSEPLYHYVQRPNSISRNYDVNMGPIDASIAQLEFFNEWFPEYNYVAETSCFFSHIIIYNSYIRQGRKCPSKLLVSVKKIAKKYLHSVLFNPHIPKGKKFQAVLFCYCLPVYDLIIQRRKHR